MPDPQTDTTQGATPPVAGQEGGQPVVDGQQQGQTTPQEQGEPQEQTPEAFERRLLNNLQSWIGRRDKELREQIIKEVSEKIVQRPPVIPQFQPQPQVEHDPEPDPDIDVRAWYAWKQRDDQRRTVQAQQQAEQVYFGMIQNPAMRHPDDQIHQSVMAEIKHVQNVDPMTMRPLGPAADAALNYSRALQTVLAKTYGQSSQPTGNPLHGNTPPKSGFGVSQVGNPSNSEPPVSMPRSLSDKARRLAEHSGWNAAKVREIIKE